MSTETIRLIRDGNKEGGGYGGGEGGGEGDYVSCCCWSLLYSAILRSLEQTHCAGMRFCLNDQLFNNAFFNIHLIGVRSYSADMAAWCHMKLLPSRRVLCTRYNHAPCHFMQSHIGKVYACLAVTCHLRFGQNDRSFSCYCGNTGVERIPK